MALFLKENQELQGNMYDIPKELEDHLKDTLNKYQDYGTTASGTMSKGFKRLQSLVDPNYNKQDDNTSEDGSRQISFSDMKRIKHDFDHMSKDPHNIQRVLNGGEKMASFVNDTLRKERTKVEPVLKQKEVETRNKNAVKPTDAPMKPIEVGNITANVHENIIKESYEDHPYWEMLENYDAYYVFECFDNKKDLWRPLIQPQMYQKALKEFTRYGQFIKFPTNYVYQWMGIIMKNTAILRACTDICGHSTSVPIDEFINFFFGDDETMFEDYKKSHGLDNDYDAMWEFLYEKGWDDYSKLPDGSDAISDYGIKPLEQIISEYNSNLEPEKVIVLINRLLDVVHCRGDIASMFIVGGSKTLSTISEEIKKKKTIFISEEQLNVLREYRDQLELPFEDPHTDNLYMRPNYQHYIDFLESIGRYGQLPKSKCDIQKYVDAHFDDAVDDWWSEEADRFNGNELYDYYLKEFFEQYQDNFYELFSISPQMVDEYLDDKDYTSNLIDYYLSDLGKKLWQDYLDFRFEDELSAYNFPYNLTINDRGLIYVERVIVLPNLNDYKFHTSLYNNRKDLYKHLTNNYEGVGICWSWAKNGGESYNGSEFDVNLKPQSVTLRGWVKCDDINWEETLMMNAYNLSHEREIRLPYKTEVEIFEIVLSDGKKLPLKQPIIVLT